MPPLNEISAINENLLAQKILKLPKKAVKKDIDNILKFYLEKLKAQH